MAHGEVHGRDMTYLNEVAMTKHRVVVAGANQDGCKLPTADDPTKILGISREGRDIGKQELVRVEGQNLVEAGGTCTNGARARVLNGGKVADVETNATPAKQQCIGWFRSSGVSGDLVTVLIDIDEQTQ